MILFWRDSMKTGYMVKHVYHINIEHTCGNGKVRICLKMNQIQRATVAACLGRPTICPSGGPCRLLQAGHWAGPRQAYL